MSTNQKQDFTLDEILETYNFLKDANGKPVIEAMEPGKVYTVSANKRTIDRLAHENDQFQKKLFCSNLLNIVLCIIIIVGSFFACKKFRELSVDFKNLSNSYDSIMESRMSINTTTETLSQKISPENLKTNFPEIFIPQPELPEEIVTVEESTVVVDTDEITEEEVEDIIESEEEVEDIVEVEEETPMTPTVNTTLPEKFADIPLDDNLKAYIYQSAIDNKLPPEILFGIAWKETVYDPTATSETDDHGLFQINESNFKSLADKFGYNYKEMWEKVYDPYINTDFAISILKECRYNYRNDNWHHVLMRYNMGPGTTAELFAKGIYSSTYSRKTINYIATNFNFTNIEI